MPEVARYVRSLSVIVNDVPALVDFEHLEFILHVHGLSECRGEMNLDAQVALLYHVATRSVAHVQGDIETEDCVAVMEVPARQTVLFVLRHLSGRGEQFALTPDVPSIRENRKKGIGGHQSTVHIYGEDVDVVVLCRQAGFQCTAH